MMNKLKIKDLAKQIRGVSYKTSDLHEELDSQSVILLRANNISNGLINFDDVIYVDKQKVSEIQYLKKGDILICASSGSKKLVGKAASVDFDMECTFGAFCKVVRPKEEYMDYLGSYFQSSIYRNKISKASLGANINNIRNEHIDGLEIPLYSKENMSTITKRMQLLQKIIININQELKLLDELVKARFVELFGDVRSNNNYPNVLFSECVEHSLRGPFGSDMKKSLYVPKNENTIKVYIQINAIQKNENLGDYYISKEYYDDKMYKFEVFPNEYIITCDGTLGKLLKLSKNMEKGVISSSLLKLKLNYSLITDQYFEYVWNLCLLPQLISEARNACLVHLPSMKVIGSKKIQLPPLELQNQFADFVKEVDKSRLEVQKSLKKTQELFDSLMQKYFG